MTDESTITDAQATLNAGMALAAPSLLDINDGDVYGVVVPDGAERVIIDTEQYAPAPRRPRGTYRPATVEAFLALLERHASVDDTTIWVHPSNGEVIAVFNDQAGVTPAWRDHRAELRLIMTDEWNHWISRDDYLGTQTEFAHHIEDGLTELLDPPAADMLELAQTFQATQNASFRSAIRLRDGNVQTSYVEEQDAQAGVTGQMTIPSEFKLAIAPFLGEPVAELTARLRYRQVGGKLTIGYKLVQPRHVVRGALDAIAARIAAIHPVVYLGQPE